MWQYLLKNWLRAQAQEKVAEAVQQRAEEVKSGGSPPAPCDVGLVFALGIEAGGMIDLMSDVVSIQGHGLTAHEGTLDDRRLIVMQSGAGREAAARATEALISGHQPQWVVSAGLAGGLSKDVPRGDFLMANHVADVEGNSMAIDFHIDADVLAGLPHLHVGRLLTVDAIVRTPEEKRSLATKHNAVAVDMETTAVADVCRHQHVRFLSVRIISDGTDDQLPKEVEHLLRQKTTASRLGAAAGAMFRRPSSVKDMLKLKEDALVLSDQLAVFLQGVLPQLPVRKER
jgi:adenosylhomocysteine nucleosidase